MRPVMNFIIIFFIYMNFCPILQAEKKEPVITADSMNTASTYSRLCEESDLYGLWKVARWIPYFEVQGSDWTKPAFLKNQWLLFDGQGGLKYLAANLEIKLDDVQTKLADTTSIISVKFTRKGFMDLQPPEKGASVEHWRCAVAKKDLIIKAMNIEVKKGDILMTMFGKDNTIRFFRLLRRVNE